jgi:hypothetical protein
MLTSSYTCGDLPLAHDGIDMASRCDTCRHILIGLHVYLASPICPCGSRWLALTVLCWRDDLTPSRETLRWKSDMDH